MPLVRDEHPRFHCSPRPRRFDRVANQVAKQVGKLSRITEHSARFGRRLPEKGDARMLGLWLQQADRLVNQLNQVARLLLPLWRLAKIEELPQVRLDARELDAARLAAVPGPRSGSPAGRARPRVSRRSRRCEVDGQGRPRIVQVRAAAPSVGVRPGTRRAGGPCR